MNDINKYKNKSIALENIIIDCENDLKTAKSEEYKMSIRNNLSLLYEKLNKYEECINANVIKLGNVRGKGIYLFYLFNLFILFHKD